MWPSNCQALDAKVFCVEKSGMLKTPICALLVTCISFAQDPQVAPVSTQQLETKQAPAVDPNQKPVKVVRKSNKAKWIVVAVVAGITVTALLLVDKRLANEGGGIFR